jgi:DNA polymerase I-like protein with 3'-5' exonuclease and polymerase domains
MALFRERLPEHLDAKLVIACHDGLVVECPIEQAEEAARFLEGVMVAGMDGGLNPDLDANHPERVPLEVDVEIVDSWRGR